MAASTAGGRISAGVGMNQIGQHAESRNQEATVYVGNLDTQVSEELVWELMVQAGPVVNVYLPKDRVSGAHQGFGFVEFRGEEDADYAVKARPPRRRTRRKPTPGARARARAHSRQGGGAGAQRARAPPRRPPPALALTPRLRRASHPRVGDEHD